MVQIVCLSRSNMPLFNKSINEGVKVPLVSILALRASKVAGMESSGVEVMSAVAGNFQVIWASYTTLSFIILADKCQCEKMLRHCTEIVHHYLGLTLGEKLHGSDEHLKKSLREIHINSGLNFLLSGMGQVGESTWLSDLTHSVDYTFPRFNQKEIQCALNEFMDQSGRDAICVLIERKALVASSRWENLPISDTLSLVALAQAALHSSSVSVNITQHGARQFRVLVISPQIRILILFPEDSRPLLTTASELENNFIKKLRKLNTQKVVEFFPSPILQGFACIDSIAKKSYWSLNPMPISGDQIKKFNVLRNIIKNNIHTHQEEFYGCLLDMKFYNATCDRWRFILIFGSSVSLCEMRSTLRLLKRRVSELE